MSDDGRDLVIVRKVSENCTSILDRLERYDIDESIFFSNVDYREMILFPLVQIGELANRLSKEFISEHHDIPWLDIIGMRNVIVHGYGSIDPRWTWNTIQADIPALKSYCENILHV